MSFSTVYGHLLSSNCTWRVTLGINILFIRRRCKTMVDAPMHGYCFCGGSPDCERLQRCVAMYVYPQVGNERRYARNKKFLKRKNRLIHRGVVLSLFVKQKSKGLIDSESLSIWFIAGASLSSIWNKHLQKRIGERERKKKTSTHR